MILIDSSVWVDHLREPDVWLAGLLRSRQVLSHPFVRGELALGNAQGKRDELLDLLATLGQVTVAENEQVIEFVAAQQLHGRGIGLVDAHLLLSTRMTRRATLWSKDKRLIAVAREFSIAYAGSLI